jgi:tetratricopeptide (TPR) repeat protein
MSFWRKDVIEPALDQDMLRLIEEQKAWIAREPANPRPYYNLAQFYRMTHRQEEALGLFLHAAALDEGFADVHLALVEMYAVKQDYAAAWRHARKASASGDARGVELLGRYGVKET